MQLQIIFFLSYNISFSITGSVYKDKFIDIDDPPRPECFEGEFGDKYFGGENDNDDGKPCYVTLPAPLCLTSLPRSIFITFLHVLANTFQTSH